MTAPIIFCIVAVSALLAEAVKAHTTRFWPRLAGAVGIVALVVYVTGAL